MQSWQTYRRNGNPSNSNLSFLLEQAEEFLLSRVTVSTECIPSGLELEPWLLQDVGDQKLHLQCIIYCVSPKIRLGPILIFL